MAVKKQKLTPAIDNPAFKSRNANDTRRNQNRGNVHDEFEDEWQDPLSWTVKQVGELQKADLRRNKGEQYAIIVQDQTELDNLSNNSVSWVNRIFNTFFPADTEEDKAKQDDPGLKTFKCYFPDGPDQCLPKIQNSMDKTPENLKSNQGILERIDRVTTFTAKTKHVDCNTGDAVYIDFQNRENFESGIITERIATASETSEAIRQSTNQSARTAFKRRTSGLSFNSPTALQTYVPTGGLSELLNFIASGEGGYDSMNQGTPRSSDTTSHRILGSTHDSSEILPDRLTNMTLAEIMAAQALPRFVSGSYNPDRLFAAGRYQIIPDTMKSIVASMNIDRNDVFNATLQDKLGLGLIEHHAPLAWQYVNGEHDDHNIAIEALAKVWASIPMPFDASVTFQGATRSVRIGQSRFPNNRASHTVEEVKKALDSARADKTHIPVLASAE